MRKRHHHNDKHSTSKFCHVSITFIFFILSAVFVNSFNTRLTYSSNSRKLCLTNTPLSSTLHATTDPSENTDNEKETSELKKNLASTLERASFTEGLIDEANQKVEKAKSDVTSRENLLQKIRREWTSEKNSLKEKISFLTRDSSNIEEELSGMTDIVKRNAEKQRAEMAARVDFLSQELERTVENDRQNDEATEEAITRVEKLQEMLNDERSKMERERDEFEKKLSEDAREIAKAKGNKIKLEKAVEEEREKFNLLEENMNEERGKLAADLVILREELEEERKLRRTETAAFGKAQRRIKEEWESIVSTFKSDKKKERLQLRDELNKKDEEISDLLVQMNDIKLLTSDVDDQISQTKAEEAQITSESDQIALQINTTIETTNTELEKLNSQVQTFEEIALSYKDTIGTIEEDIEDESSKSSYLTTQIQNEKDRATKEQNGIMAKISQIIKIRQLEMSEQAMLYAKRKRQMTSDIIAVKNKARRDENALRTTYRAKIREIENKITRIRLDSDNSIREMDIKIAERRSIIREMEREAKDLRNEIVRREDKIEMYETVFGEQCRLLWGLGRKRVRNGGRRVKNWFRKEKKAFDV